MTQKEFVTAVLEKMSQRSFGKREVCCGDGPETEVGDTIHEIVDFAKDVEVATITLIHNREPDRCIGLALMFDSTGTPEESICDWGARYAGDMPIIEHAIQETYAEAQANV